MGTLNTVASSKKIHEAVLAYLMETGQGPDEAYEQVDDVCRFVFKNRPSTTARSRVRTALNKIYKGTSGLDIPGHRKRKALPERVLRHNAAYTRRFENGIHIGMAVQSFTTGKTTPEVLLVRAIYEADFSTPSKPKGTVILCPVHDTAEASGKRLLLATVAGTYEEAQHPGIRPMRPAMASVNEVCPCDMDEYQAYLSWERSGQCDEDSPYQSLEVEAAQLSSL